MRPAAEEAHARLLAETLPLVTYAASCDLPWAVTYISPQVEGLLGFPPAVWTEGEESWLERMASDDRDRFMHTFEQLRHVGGTTTVDYRMRAADGNVVWIRDTAVLAPDQEGTPLVQGFLLDLTREKELERSGAADRAEAELHYRRLIEQLPLVTYVNEIAPVWRATFVSPQIEELFGYSVEQWLVEPDLGDRVIHPEDVGCVRAAERASRAAGRPFELEYRVVRADGTVRWVLDLMQTVTDDAGRPLYEQGFLVDVTNRKESEQLFRAVFEGSLDGIVIFDDEGRYIDANSAAREIFGQDPRGVNFRHVGWDASAEGHFDALLRLGAAHGVIRLSQTDGQAREIEFAARADVLPGRHVSVLRDVTERNRLEGRLLEAQKLESVGRLAGGIAHDFNNMLTAIDGYVHLLRATLDAGSIEREHLEEIARAAGRAATLTRQLLAVGRRQMLQPRLLSLNELVRGLTDPLQRMVGEHIELEVELEPDLPATTADGSQIEQLLLNLVLNGAEAMPGGGRLTIRAATAEHGANGLPEGAYVSLSVTDTGIGIDAETMAHLFEPFFTTKDVGRGVGLGLATAYGIAQQSGGTILVESTPGSGATFTVLLPAAHGPAT